MVQHHRKLKRLAISGLSTAALAFSLLAPGIALADGLPSSITLRRSFNDNQVNVQLAKNDADQAAKQWSSASNSSDQTGKIWQSQPNDLKGWASASAANYSDPYASSAALNVAKSGDATAYGNVTWVGIGSYQNADASANGNATTGAINTGDANGTGGDAYANGGDQYQANLQKTGDGGNSLAGSLAKNTSVAKNGEIEGGDGGDAKALCAVGDATNPGDYNGNDWECTKGSSANATGGAGGGVTADPTATATGTASSTATAGNGGNSGSNTGTNTATSTGGTAVSAGYGGETGKNTSTAVVAGGIAGNSLSVTANTSGDVSATSGAATNTGDPTSSATASATQTATPSITQDLSNYPVLKGTVNLSNPQTATTGQTSTNTATQTNTGTATNTSTP